ncbi:hypothetical protein ACLOJK_006609 [Asimina triloba]
MFDADSSGSVDLEEFKAEMRKIMLAMARRIGDSPVHMVLDSNSCLMRAVERELARQKGQAVNILTDANPGQIISPSHRFNPLPYPSNSQNPKLD